MLSLPQPVATHLVLSKSSKSVSVGKQITFDDIFYPFLCIFCLELGHFEHFSNLYHEVSFRDRVSFDLIQSKFLLYQYCPCTTLSLLDYYFVQKFYIGTVDKLLNYYLSKCYLPKLSFPQPVAAHLVLSKSSKSVSVGKQITCNDIFDLVLTIFWVQNLDILSIL